MNRFLILAVVAQNAFAFVPPSGRNVCPLVPLRSPDVCDGRVSECWSPGDPDRDCPNDGLCCFDGCANVCASDLSPISSPNPVLEDVLSGTSPAGGSAGDRPDSPPSVPDAPPTGSCTIEYILQTETVEVEMCDDVPDGGSQETCTDVPVCTSQCQMFQANQTIEEEVECCTKTQRLVCDELPCNPEDGVETEVSVGQTVCQMEPEFCFTIPEQVCKSRRVVECLPVEEQQCQVVKKPTEWPTTRNECTTKYEEECAIELKEECAGFGRSKHWKTKKHHHKFARDGCKWVPHKVCSQRPVTSCQEVQTVTIEYEDAEECQTVVREKCELVVSPHCDLENRKECIEEHETCETRNVTKTVFVAKDCSVPELGCQWVDDVSCQTTKNPVVKQVPKRECQNVCVPSSRDCHTAEPSRSCRKVPQGRDLQSSH